MLVTELGMVTEVRLEQPLNADRPMFVTELEIVIVGRFEQPEKRLSQMAVTLAPIVTSDKCSLKQCAVAERLRPRYNFLMELGRQLLPVKLNSESPSFNVNVSRLEQPENANLPMVVTEFGMVIWGRLEHPEKSLSLIAVTLAPIVTSAKKLPK